jgi:metaxin
MAYCKFADAPVHFKKTNNPWRSPSGELPVMRHDGITETRVTQIFEHLRKQGFNIDQTLTSVQSADSVAFIGLINEKLMPALLHQWWVDTKTYVEVTRPWYARALGLPLSLYLPLKKRNSCLARLSVSRGGGLANEAEVESLVMRDAKECLNILSIRLGDHDYFFGDKPTSLDAVVFGYLAPLLKAPLPNTPLQMHLKACRNLLIFCQKILTKYFPLSMQEQEAARQREEEDRLRTAEQTDFPHRRRNMALAGLTVVAAMLAYALFTGLLQIEFINIDRPVDGAPAEAEVARLSDGPDEDADGEQG